MSFTDSLHALLRDSNAIWGFLVAGATVLALTPAVVWLAPRIGGVDDKADRPRVHGGKPIPRIGGLAIVVAIALATAILVKPEGVYLGILLGTLMVAALGLIDDIRGINAGIKMLGIVVAALIPVVGFDMTWQSGGLPLVGNFDLGWAAYPLTIFWIALLANLVNLIDGMDGLASGSSRSRRARSRFWPRRSCAQTRPSSRRSSAERRSRSFGTTTTRPRSSWATRVRSRSGSCSRASPSKAC